MTNRRRSATTRSVPDQSPEQLLELAQEYIRQSAFGPRQPGPDCKDIELARISQEVTETIYDGPTVFAHPCKLGLEGVVSKRKDSAYRSGRSPDWLKMKNADAPAVKREAKEDWGKQRR
jgi:hypothetical protein